MYKKIIKIDSSNLKEYYTFTLNSIPSEIANTIETSGILFVSEKLSNDINIRKDLQKNVIIPLKDSINVTLKEFQEECNIDKELIEMLGEKFYSSILDLYTTIPLKEVLSLIMIKCINENVTFLEAALEYDLEELEKDAIENLEITDLSYLKSEFSDTLKASLIYAEQLY